MMSRGDTLPAPAHWGESTVEWVTSLALASAGMASGFTHLVRNAQRHQVTTWLAWATAVTVELTAVYAAVKLRRRLAEQRAAWPVAVLLVAGFALSMASQLAQAEPTPWGWVYNGWPVVACLWVAKLTLSDLGHRAGVTAQRDWVTAEREAEVQRLTTQVHELGQRLGQADDRARVMTQQAADGLDQMTAERDRLGGEVRRLTALLDAAEQDRRRRLTGLTAPPAADPTAITERVGSAGDGEGGQVESQAERASRLAVAHRDDTGDWPTQGALADAAGVSVSTAKRVLRDLRGLTVLDGTG